MRVPVSFEIRNYSRLWKTINNSENPPSRTQYDRNAIKSLQMRGYDTLSIDLEQSLKRRDLQKYQNWRHDP